MSDVISLIRSLAAKIKAGEATVWDYLELISLISQALLDLRRSPIGAATEAGQADELMAAADELSDELQGEPLEVASEGALATAALMALLRLLLKQL